MSGSTLSVVLTTDEDFIYTANVGDSQVLLFTVDRNLKKLNDNIADKEDNDEDESFNQTFNKEDK